MGGALFSRVGGGKQKESRARRSWRPFKRGRGLVSGKRKGRKAPKMHHKISVLSIQARGGEATWDLAHEAV